ncbi:DoxX family protein [Halodesulfurarchaeum sp. HSR-GB]|uniref:DoxX family protein n=1 Tax=Halodesulfurarchaeum sp. HSR-GB TaxID=3074077 RepID=UPI0028648A8A|nr:DoxX family protein [Halodesulfurarchaeum sp. HSR-GB]MDR5656450.1 DoxX family protein [Halodesulfurarchaeum sp. HSR-GB]
MSTQPSDSSAVEPSEQTGSIAAELRTLDQRVTGWMADNGLQAARLALGIVFVWFGALKVIGVSPAAPLVAEAVWFLPAGIFVPVLGIWEMLIGLGFLYRPWTRIGLVLLALQMPGTFLPVVLVPEAVFTAFPYGLTLEGQYIVKNFVIIGAALIIGGSLQDTDRP